MTLNEKFKSDLSDGQVIEKTVNEFLKTKPELMAQLIKWESTSTYGKFDGYDLGGSFKIEIKHDIKSQLTSNLAFEYKNSHTGKSSGIYSSRADYIFYVTENHYYIFDRIKLIEDIDCFNNEYCFIDGYAINTGFKIREQSGDGNADLYIYRIHFIENHFTSLIHKIERN